MITKIETFVTRTHTSSLQPYNASFSGTACDHHLTPPTLITVGVINFHTLQLHVTQQATCLQAPISIGTLICLGLVKDTIVFKVASNLLSNARFTLLLTQI